METFVVRVWVPDRPGALGQVASRIGAVRGDLIGIDILERGGGRAIDELVVQLPGEELVPLMVDEMSELDGADVEDVRSLEEAPPDARVDSLETAAALVEQRSLDDLLAVLAEHARHDFEADWAVLVSADGAEVLAGAGAVPPAPWLQAFVAGSGASVHLSTGEQGPDDVAWAELPAVARTLVLGREGRPLRSRERRQLSALARIAGVRWSELAPPGGDGERHHLFTRL